MKKNRRLTAADWVELGLKELAVRGPEAVKLEAICHAAQMTRGSFYHHFKGHAAFLLALAEAWKKRATDEIVSQLEPIESAQAAAASLTESARAIDYRLELGIRELARRFPAIATVVTETDETRLSILSDLYVARFGLEPDMASDVAFLEYAAFSGMILLNTDMPDEKQRALAAMFDGLVKKALRASDE